MAGWRDDGDALIRDLEFANFAEAMAFVNEVAEVAERENHHPDIAIHGWNKVRLALFTHSENRITEADRAMAAKIDELDQEAGADAR